MALSQQKQQIRIFFFFLNSKLRGAKWCPKESRKEKESKCWDFPRQVCFPRPRCTRIKLQGNFLFPGER